MIDGKVLLRVDLVRHAESKKNVVHLPWIPEEELDTLTAAGQKQAEAIGNFLKDKGIVVILSSPAGRTRETAKAIGQVIGFKTGYEVEKAFASLRGGNIRMEIRFHGPGARSNGHWDRIHCPEGGESLSDGEFRATGVLKKLVEKFPGRIGVIVSHTDICAALLGYPYAQTE
ncbi:MAG: phosphoglycerate mutase family protein [Nitrospirota bacterium]|nr:phosphoglycerate mutase family protein [Nitrospirota bacterium]